MPDRAVFSVNSSVCLNVYGAVVCAEIERSIPIKKRMRKAVKLVCLWILDIQSPAWIHSFK